MPDPQKYNVKTVGNLSLGQNGVVVETGTTAITGIRAVAIQMLSDTVFTSLTENGATGDGMDGFTIQAGTVIYGDFTAFELASGAVRAYLGLSSPS